MNKPQNTSGMNCPLHHKPCSQVCHTCELWRDLWVSEGDKQTQEWHCSLYWPVFQLGILGARADGMQQATEGLRNQFAEFKNSLLALVGAVAGVHAQIERAKQVEEIAHLKETQTHLRVIDHKPMEVPPSGKE